MELFLKSIATQMAGKTEFSTNLSSVTMFDMKDLVLKFRLFTSYDKSKYVSVQLKKDFCSGILASVGEELRDFNDITLIANLLHKCLTRISEHKVDKYRGILTADSDSIHEYSEKVQTEFETAFGIKISGGKCCACHEFTQTTTDCHEQEPNPDKRNFRHYLCFVCKHNIVEKQDEKDPDFYGKHCPLCSRQLCEDEDE